MKRGDKIMETRELGSLIIISLLLMSLGLMVSLHCGKTGEIVYATNVQSTILTPPIMEWNKTYGVETSPACAIQTEDRGYAIAGCIQLPEGTTGYLIKTDSSGNKLWDQGYGDTGFVASGIQTKDGGYAIIGKSGLLIKTDSSGNMQWNQTYTGITGSGINSILQTSDGAYTLAGSIDNSVSNFWLARTDSLGNMQWNRTYGGTGDSLARSLIQTSDGGYALIGNTDLNSSIPVLGGYDIWVVKTDSEGNLQWNQTYGVPGYDDGSMLIQTEDGGYTILARLSGHGISLLKLAGPTRPSTFQVSDIVLYVVIAAAIAIVAVVAAVVFKRRKEIKKEMKYEIKYSPISVRKISYLKAILFLFIASLCLSSLIVKGQAASWSWNKVPSPTDASVEALDMINSTDGWAVGGEGSIIHWDGTSWNNVTSPTTTWLDSVDMISSTDGWIVGADGIYHWQEEAPFIPADYLPIIVGGAVAVVILVIWFFLRKRRLKKKSL
jgi:hypothetical protein